MATARKLAVVSEGTQAQPKRNTQRRKSHHMNAQQRVSLVAGTAAAGALIVSLYHCTEAITRLTGSPTMLSLAMAVAIDAAMVAMEVSELVSVGTKRHREVSKWSCVYITIAVVVSMLLNAYGFCLHCQGGRLEQGASITLGIAVPIMIFSAGRAAGHLWLAGKTIKV